MGLNMQALVGGVLANGALSLACAERISRSHLVLAGLGAGAMLVSGSTSVLYLVIAALFFNSMTLAYRRAWLMPTRRELRSGLNRTLIVAAALAFVFGLASWGAILIGVIWFVNRGRIVLDRSRESIAIATGLVGGVLLAVVFESATLALPSWPGMIAALGSAPERLAQSFSGLHPRSLGVVCLICAGGAIAIGLIGKASDGYRTALLATALAFSAGLSNDFIAMRVVLNLSLGLAVARSRYPLLVFLLTLPIIVAAIIEVMPL